MLASTSVAAKLAQLQHEIEQFTDSSTSNYVANESELTFRKWICRKILMLVREKFGEECTLQCFGSSQTGLLLANSDIDVVVFTPAPAPPETTTPTRTTVFDETFEDPEREHNLRILRTLRETLHKSGLPLQSSIRLVGEANVPVLKFVEKITRIPVDVSVNNSHGMISTEIIQNWIREYPPLRPVTLLIKHYVWRAGMNDTYTGGFGSYVIVNMVVFMFKQFPTLLEGPDIYAKTFICFLRYYGTLFNYRQYGISTIDNVAFKLSQDHRVWQNPARAESVPFVVEDPTNRKRNVGKSASNAECMFRMFAKDFVKLQTALENWEPADSNLSPSSSILRSFFESMECAARHSMQDMDANFHGRSSFLRRMELCVTGCQDFGTALVRSGA